METRFEMVAAVAGYGLASFDDMDAVLNWYLPEECFLLIHEGELHKNAGLRAVQSWCDDVNQEYSRIKYDSNVIENLLSYKDKADSLSLIVLGVEGNTEIIREAWDNNIEVADLTRAMYIVQQGIDLEVALREPVSHAHEISDGLGGRGSLEIFAPQNGSEDRTGNVHLHKPYEACYDDCPEPHYSEEDAEKRSAEWNAQGIEKARTSLPSEQDPLIQMMKKAEPLYSAKELEEIVAGYIRAHEERYHTPEVAHRKEHIVASVAGEDDDTISKMDKVRCIMGKDGIAKTAPRRQPKPGEKVVWLSAEEVTE